jgi:hypothetical protein
MIGLMHLAPHGAPPTCLAQMYRIVCPAAAHLPPITIADGADAATTVTDDDRSAGLAFLVTHMLPSSLSCTSLCSHGLICA